MELAGVQVKPSMGGATPRDLLAAAHRGDEHHWESCSAGLGTLRKSEKSIPEPGRKAPFSLLGPPPAPISDKI